MKVCTLHSRHQTHSQCSGYDLLGYYLESAEHISAPRGNLPILMGRQAGQILRKFSATKWYQGSSVLVEWEASRALLKKKPDILHYLWTDHDAGYLPFWVKRLSCSTKLCGTFHLSPNILEEVVRRPNVLKHFDAIILMCWYQASYFKKIGISENRLHCIKHGVDTAYFNPRKKREQKAFEIISVGGFMRDFDLLKAVCIECLKFNIDIKFKIIGPASRAFFFQECMNVKYLSEIDDEQLAVEYASASCLLITPVDATANNALLEGMSSGLPVVATNVGGISEYVDDTNAFLISVKEPQPIVEAIITLVKATELRESMSKASREMALELDWKKVACQTMELYSRLLQD